MSRRRRPELNEIIKRIASDPAVRRAATRRSHFLFFHVFFGPGAKRETAPFYETAPFQKEMFRITEAPQHKLAVIMAFRGSGKSTILNLSYALWSILGVRQKKCVLIVSRTQNQAKTHLWNIRHELESNTLLRADLGPFKTDGKEWGSLSLMLPSVGARIIAVSREQSVRGIRNAAHRPDLIICDDLEDTTSVQSEDDRDATYRWMVSEVLPLGGPSTRIVIIGNLLRYDSLLMRLKEDIDANRLEGTFHAYPLLDDDGRILWVGRFPTAESVLALKRTIPDKDVWMQEYLLWSSVNNGNAALPFRIVVDGKEVGGKEEAVDLRRRFEPFVPNPPLRGMAGYRISAPILEPHVTVIYITKDVEENSDGA